MYGLLGKTLGHSLSPQIHSYFGDYPYELFCREPDELDDFFADDSIKAFNVTIPYKIEAYNRCDILSETAEKIKSVNTVVKKDGKLYGYNTDLFGFLYTVKKLGADLKGKKVIILGSGGASRTVKAACDRENAAETVIISRSGENNYNNISLHTDADIIINTTPVGMFPENDASPVDLSIFNNLQAVIDLIYNPIKTRLLLQAEALGIPCSNGLSMLVAQGLKSSELFFGTKLDEALIEKAFNELSSQMKNIVLIGMPGCGKTTVGKKLAALTGRSFRDTDDLIESASGKTIPDIFEEDGEEKFRIIESSAVSSCAKKLGIVIATGGGAILRKSNRISLKQNGVIVYLRRPVEELSQAGRPLSAGDDAVKRLYDQRSPIYEALADYIIDVGSSPEVTADTVLKTIKL